MNHTLCLKNGNLSQRKQFSRDMNILEICILSYLKLIDMEEQLYDHYSLNFQMILNATKITSIPSWLEMTWRSHQCC